MKGIKLILVSTVVAFLLFSCSKESADATSESLNPSEYYQELNISYGPDSKQVFDLYLPKNRTSSTKVMILVHGGGWTSGDKMDMNGFKDILRQDLPDVAIVNINYRLADDAHNPYPMQIDDISTILKHLKDKQNFYVISDAFGFTGVSAGAHLAMLWSYAFDSDKHVKMVCSIVGPTNFTDPAYLNSTDVSVQTMFNSYGINATTAFLEEVSPYHQATASAPPTILFYGAQDPLIPRSQGTDMKNRLQQLGVTHEYTLYENAGHGWVGLDLLDTWIKLRSFIQFHL